MKTNQKQVLSYFEQAVHQRLPYWLFWPAQGLFFFVCSEIIIRYFAEQYMLITRLIFAACVGIFPIIIIVLSHTFRPTMVGLSSVVWNNSSEFDIWCSKKEAVIFSVKTKRSKLINAIFVIGGIATIMVLGWPLKNPVANLLGLLGFIYILRICSLGGVALTELILTLYEIRKMDVHVPFFRLPHPAFIQMQNYYSSTALFITGSYVLLVLAIWQSPYGLTTIMLVWLAILSFYPFGLFAWSTFQIHQLIQKVKQEHLDLANGRVQSALKKAVEKDDSKAYEQLEKAMGLQAQVQKLPEWIIEPSGMITFLVTITTAIGQTVLAVITAINP